jgi:chitinase
LAKYESGLAFVHRADLNTTLGFFIPAGGSAKAIIATFQNHVRDKGYPGKLLIQGCEEDPSGDGNKNLTDADRARLPGIYGIIAASGPSNLAVAQKAVREWSHSRCVSTGYDAAEKLSSTISLPNSSPLLPKTTLEVASDMMTTSAVATEGSTASTPQVLRKRAQCRTAGVSAGNLCGDLARKCGISLSELMSFNRGLNCNNLQEKQKICCNSGSLSPEKQADGTCATHKVEDLEGCWDIATANSISVENLETWNRNTWGWGGCGPSMQAQILICISPGDPPMPLPVAGTDCGPIKPGTSKPPAGTKLVDLNPCPLNACCGVFGFCGTTTEFCEPVPAGPPGAPRPAGSPICISNCGTDIVNDETPPQQFRRERA